MPTVAVVSPLPPPVVIEKSNELVAPPEPEKKGFFSLFGTKPKGKYITPALRDQISRPAITKGRWKYIVVHNSGTRQGNAKAFEDYHRRVRKMQNGLAYHFVIGNGTSTGDGQIEIGNRWKIQQAGGHVHSDYLNNVGIGICLVGDYNHHKPTPKQLESLEELIRFLRNRVGKSEGKEVVVKPHREINPPRWPTDCPGDQFPYSWLKSRF
jgi:N-acetyl-anhydromuramyl-L-alanine amidase AmpD